MKRTVERPRHDQSNFHAFLDEDGARALVAGRVPGYVKRQCQEFLLSLHGVKAMVRMMRRSARAERRKEVARERARQG